MITRGRKKTGSEIQEQKDEKEKLYKSILDKEYIDNYVSDDDEDYEEGTESEESSQSDEEESSQSEEDEDDDLDDNDDDLDDNDLDDDPQSGERSDDLDDDDELDDLDFLSDDSIDWDGIKFKLRNPPPKNRLLKLCEDESEDIKSELIHLQKLIEEDDPNIVKIMNTKMKEKDKYKLIELYEVYRRTASPSEDKLLLKQKVKKMLKRCVCDYQAHIQNEKLNEVNGNVWKVNGKECDLDTFLKEESERIKNITLEVPLKQRILTLNTNCENKAYIYKKYKELKDIDESDENYAKLKVWLMTAVSLPFDNVKVSEMTLLTHSQSLAIRATTKMNKYMCKLRSSLDEELYGMSVVKEKLLLIINSRLSNPNMKGCSLGLIGSPGTGKTHISRALSRILDIPFQQISFGGMTTPDFLKGHEYTYVGAQSGEISRCLSRMKYKNGIMFFDEYEKISDNKRIVSSLLHITDTSQNSDFKDSYLSPLTQDLSSLWFIYSMNSLPTDEALRNRIEVIKVPGYSLSDKVRILIDFLLPRAIKNTFSKTIINKHKNEGCITISEDVSRHIINKVCDQKDKGVRVLNDAIQDIVSKINFLVSSKLKDGTLGDLKVTFQINNAKLPFEITRDVVDKFIKKPEIDNMSALMMYQ